MVMAGNISLMSWILTVYRGKLEMPFTTIWFINEICKNLRNIHIKKPYKNNQHCKCIHIILNLETVICIWYKFVILILLKI